MKPLYILVEGDSEEEFVKDALVPFFAERGIFEVVPIKISTKVGFKGGFVKYSHLKRDAILLLKQRGDIILTTLVDYFRLPNDVPNYLKCQLIHDVSTRISHLETAMLEDIGNNRFIPYIQKIEFESLLFSSNSGFENYYGGKIARETGKIVEAFPNPEEINSNPATSPSNRLKKIIPQYDKILVGSIIALEIGIENIIEKCPRFRNWIDSLIRAVST